MKNVRRVLSMAMVLLLLLGLFPLAALPVAAEDEDIPLLLDEVYTVTLEEEENAWFIFTAPKAGAYQFRAINEDYCDSYAVLYNEDFYDIDYSDEGGGNGAFLITYVMEKDETVYLEVGTYESETCAVPVQVTAASEASGICFEEGDRYVGYVGKTESFYVNSVPTDSMIGDIKWTISNPAVAVVTYDWVSYTYASADVELIGMGTTTLTATTADGKFSDSITITVTEAAALVAGELEMGVVKMGERAIYCFTAPEDGVYRFLTQHSDVRVLVEGEEGSIDSYGSVTYDLEEGQICYVTLTPAEDEDERYFLWVEKTGVATDVWIEADEQMYVYQSQWAYARFSPAGYESEYEEWYSSDPSVLDVDDSGYITAFSTGEATITVTTENGLTDSITVTVVAPPALTLGKEVRLTAVDSYYAFTPKTSGRYAFYTGGDRDLTGTLYDDFWEELDYDDDSGEESNALIVRELKAGKTYYILISAYDDYANATLCVAKAVDATSLVLEGGAKSLKMKVDDWHTLDIAAQAPYAPLTDVTVDSSNGLVVSVLDTDLVACAPGTAVITVTANNGITAQITVTVEPLLDVKLGGSYNLVESDGSLHGSFTFTPKKSGIYSFYIEDIDGMLRYWCENEDVAWMVSGKNCLQVQMKAGTTYKMYASSGSGPITRGILKVGEVTKLDTVTINNERTVFTTGETYYFDLAFSSPLTLHEDALQWTSSNPDVVKIGTYGEAAFVGVGTATITARTSQYTAAMKVTVKAAPTIEVGGTASLQFREEDGHILAFTAPKDGIYQHDVRNASTALITTITNRDLEWVETFGGKVNDDGSETIRWKAVAGETYYLETRRSYGYTDEFENLTITADVALNEVQDDRDFGIYSYFQEEYQVAEGETVRLEVDAAGEGLTYQWYYAEEGSENFKKASVTSPIYKVEMTPARAGRQLFCVVSDRWGCKAISDIVVINMIQEVKVAPLASTTVTAKPGEKATIKVHASGDNLTYYWFYKDVGNLAFSQTSSFSGPNYSVEMSKARNGRQVFCVVQDYYDNIVLTETVTLKMDTSLKITTQPKSAYAKEGAKISVKVAAAGEGLTYQWYIKNEGAKKYSKSSVTSATYTATMSDKVHNRLAYCVVTDKYGNTVQSKTVRLRRQATITKESATAAYAAKGAKASVKVTAVGDGLTYQWYIKNEGASKYSKSSVTTATYSATMSDKAKNRRVYCVVTDEYGKSVQSKTFILRESVSITTQPKTVTVAKNKTAKATVKASGDGLTYTWYIKNAGGTKYSKSSVTGATYSAKMTDKAKDRLAYCVVTDQYGNTVKTVTIKLKMK